MTAGPAEAYHRLTSYERGALPGGRLDWANQPDPWKRYPGRPVVPLPPPGDRPGPALADLVLGASPAAAGRLDAASIGRLLASAYGVTATTPRGDVFFRAAPSAGGLFPCEVYLAVPATEGLGEAGLYHYRSDVHGMTLLRAGDWTAAGAPVFVVTAVLFRSAWKYRRRAFRYHLLDTGHIAEGLALAAAAEGLSLEVEPDFDDAAVSTLLGLDPEREVPLALALPPGAPRWPAASPAAPDRDLPDASPTSDAEVAYDEIRSVIAATREVRSLSSAPERDWQAIGLAAGPWSAATEAAELPRRGLHEVTRARRSGRAYGAPAERDGARLSGLAALLCEPAPLPPWRRTVEVGLVVGEGVAGWPPGLWALDRAGRRRSLVRGGDLRSSLAAACLDQSWLSAAAVHVVLLADLTSLEARSGPRGYRHALLEAGRIGHRVYLASTALGWSACGIGAMYDGEAASLLGLAPASRVVYLVAAGPRRPPRSRSLP